MSSTRMCVIAMLALTLSACSDGVDVAEPAAPIESAGTSPDSTPPTRPSSPGTTGTTDADETSAVESGSTTPPTSVATTVAPPNFDFSEVSSIVDEFVADRGLGGAGLAIVHRDHGIIHHEHWGAFGPDRVSLIASSSKMIVAGVLLRLQDDGLLDIDRPVAEVVEWGAGNPEITPAQLVSNSSGLVGLIPDPGYGPYVCQFLAAGSLQGCAEQIFTTDGDDGDIALPDTEFRYGGAQWQVAGAVAEAASGDNWADLIEEIYVEPCGVDSLAFNNHFTQFGTVGFAYPTEFDGDPSTLVATDNPNMEGGAYITSGDYAELLLMHLRGGRCGETQVLSEEALDRMHADRIAAAYGGSAGVDVGYGMGWWIDRASGRLTDPGAYGSVPWLDLADGYGGYLVVEAGGGPGNELAGLLYDAVERAVVGN